jgi:hypothetical protein
VADALRRSGNYADGSTFWIAAPGVTPVAMDVDDLKALALLNDGFDRGQLVCDSFAATKSEQDDLARAMIRLEEIVRELAEVKP